ncbi:MAG: hypothetical protein M9929_03960 [Burkholderiaceae bacterium]|nr:hypothetical protein [Burkholderiaceae bacterium]
MSVYSVTVRRPRAPLPKFWRPKLQAPTRDLCRTIHWDLIDRFTSGTADREVLMDWMETGLTYHQFMRYLEMDGTPFTLEAMVAVTDQLAIYEHVVARFARTGRVGFSAPELLTARAAAMVFDSLLDLDRHGLFAKAALWSTEQMLKVWGAKR